MTSSNLTIFTFIMFYLIFISALYSAIIYSKEGEQISTISLGQFNYNINTQQDYTSNSTYDEVLLVPTGLVYIRGIWKQYDKVGYILTGNSALGESEICINNVLINNNEFDVTYYINNTVHQPFTIYPQHSENDKAIHLHFDDTGIHMPDFSFFGGDNFFWSDSTLMTRNNFTIKTILNTLDKTLTVYDNDVLLFTITDNINPLDKEQNLNPVYFAGFSSQTVGFTIEKIITTTFTGTSPETTGISSALGFFWTFLKVLAWSVDEKYLPLALNILIIKFPLFIAIVFGCMVIRGD